MNRHSATEAVYLVCLALGAISLINGLAHVTFGVPDGWQLQDRRDALERCDYVQGCDVVNATAEVERIETQIAENARANLRAIGTGALGALSAAGLAFVWRMYAGPPPEERRGRT